MFNLEKNMKGYFTYGLRDFLCYVDKDKKQFAVLGLYGSDSHDYDDYFVYDPNIKRYDEFDDMLVVTLFKQIQRKCFVKESYRDHAATTTLIVWKMGLSFDFKPKYYPIYDRGISGTITVDKPIQASYRNSEYGKRFRVVNVSEYEIPYYTSKVYEYNCRLVIVLEGSIYPVGRSDLGTNVVVLEY